MKKSTMTIFAMLLGISFLIIVLVYFLLSQQPPTCTSSHQPSEPQAEPPVQKVTGPLLFPTKICATDNFQGTTAIFVADSGHHRIVALKPDGTIVQTVGSGISGAKNGSFQEAQFNGPQGIVWDADRQILYVADTKNHLLRKVDFQLKKVSTLAGTGAPGKHHVSTQDKPIKTALSSPQDLAFFPITSIITIAQAGTNQLWLYEIDKNRLRILAGNGRQGMRDGQLPYNTLAKPSSLAVLGETLYFIDTASNSVRCFKKRDVTTLFGNRPQEINVLKHPQGIAASEDGIYIADTYNNTISFYDNATQKISTFIGDGTAGNTVGSFEETRLNEPNGLLLHDNELLIIDTNNHRIVVANLSSKQCREFEPSK